MKHCPQCEFTFDDQEQVCDFDGTELRPVPEVPPSFKTVPFAPASSKSFARRLVTSRAGLPVLALGVVMLSALLIGYFDSLSKSNVDKSTSPTRDDSATIVPSPQVDTKGQGEVQTRPRTISTQRQIGANELPSSMVKRLMKDTRSQSAKPRRDPPATKQVATTRRSSKPRQVASRHRPAKTTRQSQARNQSRPASQERSRQQHTVASGPYTTKQSQARNQSRPGSQERGRQQYTVASGSYRQPRGVTESAHHKKDSKVVAILKKTGSIFKKPFELLVGR